jgi:hypothetical protein
MQLGVNFTNNSEQALILLRVLPDFDSAIRRFDPSRPSQPVTQPKIDWTEIAESLKNTGFPMLFAWSPVSHLTQP